ncbi:MAG: hypothetical protein L0Z50_14240 [Verrucomicrobiales bacterium]|nr:hypothetical protein [Verrucomicrobiales bacterium]
MPVIHLDSDKEAEVSRKQLLDAVAALPEPELDTFIDELMTVRAQRYVPSLSTEEAGLLERINRCSLGQLEWQRFYELLERQRAEKITEAEHSEMRRLTDKMERLNVERIEALVGLAKLRSVSLEQVMDALGVKSPGYV